MTEIANEYPVWTSTKRPLPTGKSWKGNRIKRILKSKRKPKASFATQSPKNAFGFNHLTFAGDRSYSSWGSYLLD